MSTPYKIYDYLFINALHFSLKVTHQISLLSSSFHPTFKTLERNSSNVNLLDVEFYEAKTNNFPEFFITTTSAYRLNFSLH